MKKPIRKKIVSIVLIVVLAVSLCTTASAQGTVSVSVTYGNFDVNGNYIGCGFNNLYFDIDDFELSIAEIEEYIEYGFRDLIYSQPEWVPTPRTNVLDAIGLAFYFNGFYEIDGTWDEFYPNHGGCINDVLPQTTEHNQRIETIGGVNYTISSGTRWRIACTQWDDELQDWVIKEINTAGTNIQLRDGMEIIFDVSPYDNYIISYNYIPDGIYFSDESYTVTIPNTDEQTISISANAIKKKYVYGVNYSLSEPYAGVSIDSSTGVVTVTPEASAGSVDIIATHETMTGHRTLYIEEAYEGEITFPDGSFTIEIPGSGTNTLTVSASGTDENEDPIDPANITYSLENTYAGVTIDSATGVVTVTSEAVAGSVDIIATHETLACSATLNIEEGEITCSVSVTYGNFDTSGNYIGCGFTNSNFDIDDYELSIAYIEDYIEYGLQEAYYSAPTPLNANVLDAIILAFLDNGFYDITAVWQSEYPEPFRGGYIKNVSPQTTTKNYEYKNLYGYDYLVQSGIHWRIAYTQWDNQLQDWVIKEVWQAGSYIELVDGMEIIFDVSPFITYMKISPDGIFFSEDSYSVTIPNTGEQTTTISAIAGKGGYIYGVNYSLSEPYTGVSIDSSTGIVTVTPEASAGSVDIIATNTLTGHRTLYIEEAYEGEITFPDGSFTIEIPGSGTNTLTVSASGTDENEDPIDPANITYSLENTYAGVTIDSATGVVTVTSEASAGSVDIIATHETLACSATLNIEEGEISFANNIYSIEIPISGMNTLTVDASGTDAYGDPIDQENITYCLERTYTGVTIDSTTGVITVTNGALVGSVNILATYQTLTCSATLYIKEADEGEISFAKRSYSIEIPESGTNTRTISASGTDANGNPIDDISYSLEDTYTGVTIDSATGVITVTTEATEGSVNVIATYQALTCTATLNIGSGGSHDLTLSVIAGRTYRVAVSASKISTFDQVTYTVTYDDAVLQIADLCAFTHEKETTTGVVAGTGITITSVSPGEIQLTINKTIPSGFQWWGVLNIFEFTALTTGQATITIQ